MRFSERFRSKPSNVAKAASGAAARAKPRVSPSHNYYVKLHISQLVQLKEMNNPVAFMLFGLLLAESFANYGNANFLGAPIQIKPDLVGQELHERAHRRRCRRRPS